MTQEEMTQGDLIEKLNRRFAIADIASIKAGNGGLPRVRVTAPSASADIYLHGAHITSWRPHGADEVLFLSERSGWEDGRAIRGGIPVCFPWFGAKADDAKAPSHGLVRTRSWQLEAVTQIGDGVQVVLSVENDEAGRKWWAGAFRLEHRITVGSELRQELIATNTGSTPIRIEEALHTYYRVAEIAAVSVRGLDGTSYIDKRDSFREKKQQGDVVFLRQTDNAYLAAVGTLELVDPGLHRSIQILKTNSDNTIVWNPWEDGARSLADLGEEDWKEMACVEAGNIFDSAIDIPPGGQHTLSTIIRVAGLP